MEQINASAAFAPPLRILSLDGGGIRGKSSLLILERIMERISQIESLDVVPKPCEYFDLIGGTSTGGIIAIMLGRLSMTVDQCIRAYDEVAQTAFTPKWTHILPAPPNGVYSAKALEGDIQKTVRKFCVASECVAQRNEGRPTEKTCQHNDMEFRDMRCTKTVVLAITKDNVDALPTLFTTYDTSAKFHNCTIWQIARATSAATTFFKSFKLGRDKVEFIDAGFGYNNPCEVLISEAQRQFPGRHQLRVLSIGTGLGDVVSIKDSRMSILKALKDMATTSKKVAQRLDSKYGGNGQYYRFNVDRGLDDVTLSDWKKASKIAGHTLNYLEENDRTITQFVNDFVGCPGIQAETATEFGGAPDNDIYYYVPFLQNKRFVGRIKYLARLEKMLFDQKCQKIALVGLGGIGKTQLALQLAYWVKENKPEYSIFWVSALSDATFRQGYTEIARQLGINTTSQDEDPRKLVQQLLSSERSRKWLLIVDNADDTDTIFGPPDNVGGIDYFLPKSEHGRVLFTTRLLKIAIDASVDGYVELRSLDLQEAKELLERWLHRKDLLRNEAATKELLDKLTYLPLAIIQAAAYLEKNQTSIPQYLELLSGTENMVSLMKSGFRDGTTGLQTAVATTWLISFNHIRKYHRDAAEILYFLSCIEPKAIPQSIFPPKGTDEQLVSSIGTLRGYAFLSKQENIQTFEMHSLVHLATRIWVEQEGDTKEATEEATTHLAKVFPSNDYSNRRKWREYLPHALKALQTSDRLKIRGNSDLSFRVGMCLLSDGRVKEAMVYLYQCYKWCETLAEDHPDRLASQHALAIIYRANGQVQEAVRLLERVVAIEEKTLAEDHPDRLTSQYELAITYRTNGQVQEAVRLLERVVAIEEKTLAEDHPDRLTSQHELAKAYRANGQVQEAVRLLERVVAIREKTLAEDHPDRLASQHALARTYAANKLAEGRPYSYQ